MYFNIQISNCGLSKMKSGFNNQDLLGGKKKCPINKKAAHPEAQNPVAAKEVEIKGKPPAAKLPVKAVNPPDKTAETCQTWVKKAEINNLLKF